MTNKEAIEVLKLNNPFMAGKDKETFSKAIDKGIEALENQKTGHWIPVSERLPDKPYGCIVTVMDTNLKTYDEFENIYPDFVGWDGEDWNDADGYSIPFEVVAWMPLPQPYKAELKG